MNVVRLFSVVPNSYFVCIIIHICRSDFEALCADLFEGVKAPLVRVLELAQLTKEDIYSVEIVGGSTRIPLVKDIISEVYGKPVSTTLNQDEAVARGCALQCAILSPTFRVRDFSISDTQPFPIQLNWIREENEETGWVLALGVRTDTCTVKHVIRHSMGSCKPVIPFIRLLYVRS